MSAKGKETRARILDVATSEFAEHGIAGARVERIARAAACNKNLLYVYFGSKETLLGEVLARNLTRVYDGQPFTPEDLPAYAARVCRPSADVDLDPQVPSTALSTGPSITPAAPRRQRPGASAGQARQAGGRRRSGNPHVDVARRPKHRRTSTEPRRRELLQALGIFQRATPDQLWKLTRPDNRHDKLHAGQPPGPGGPPPGADRVGAGGPAAGMGADPARTRRGEATAGTEGHTGIGAAQAGVRPGHREAARYRIRRPRRGGHLDGRRTPAQGSATGSASPPRFRTSLATATCSGPTWCCRRRMPGCR
ncbi:helix-turn-helix domain-containing protein [Streptomyces sp. NPDC018347]|uniref:TetR/AcrR family transcriptional regulator n=1 Tax=Streptomyces sp. NPDC018347 TaxID=3157193 RepID=UPI0033E97B28